MRRYLLASLPLASIMTAVSAVASAYADERAISAAIPDLDSIPLMSTSGTPQPSKLDAPIQYGNPLWTIPLASLTATRERPIFSRSRRPPPSAQPTPIKSAPPPLVVNQPTRPLLTLLGAIAGDADGIAILMDESTKSIVRMKTGEKFSGWMLRSVDKRTATFEMAQQVSVLIIPNP